MTRRWWRRSVVAGAVLALLGTLGVVGAAPAAAASVPLPRFLALTEVAVPRGIAVLSIDNEGGTVQRVDPTTAAVFATRTLLPGTPTGNTYVMSDLEYSAGSLWVSEYWSNVVLRLDPTTLATQARIPTGRSPSGVVAGGGSIWVPLTNDQAISRIDPATNAVVQTIHVGSPRDLVDSPYKAAWTGTDLVASMPRYGRVVHVSTTGRVRYDQVGDDAAACADPHPVPGGYWLDDSDCESTAYYRWSDTARAITASVDLSGAPARFGWGSAVADGVFYTAQIVCAPPDCNRGEEGDLVARDVDTGAELNTRVVPGTSIAMPHLVDGAWWECDVDHGLLRRIAATSGGAA